VHYKIFERDPADKIEPTPPTPPSPDRLECHECGPGEIKTDEIPLARGGYHLRASCAKCGRYLKFLAHTPPQFFFGRHKGESVASVAKDDPSYLAWCLSNGVIRNNRLRLAVKEAVETRGNG